MRRCTTWIDPSPGSPAQFVQYEFPVLHYPGVRDGGVSGDEVRKPLIPSSSRGKMRIWSYPAGESATER
jgi:hypothetical protein